MKNWQQFREEKDVLMENVSQRLTNAATELLWNKYGSMFNNDPAMFSKYIFDAISKTPKFNQLLQQSQINLSGAAQQAAAMVAGKLQSHMNYNPAVDSGIGNQSYYGR